MVEPMVVVWDVSRPCVTLLPLITDVTLEVAWCFPALQSSPAQHMEYTHGTGGCGLWEDLGFGFMARLVSNSIGFWPQWPPGHCIGWKVCISPLSTVKMMRVGDPVAVYQGQFSLVGFCKSCSLGKILTYLPGRAGDHLLPSMEKRQRDHVLMIQGKLREAIGEKNALYHIYNELCKLLSERSKGGLYSSAPRKMCLACWWNPMLHFCPSPWLSMRISLQSLKSIILDQGWSEINKIIEVVSNQRSSLKRFPLLIPCTVARSLIRDKRAVDMPGVVTHSSAKPTLFLGTLICNGFWWYHWFDLWFTPL